MSLSSQFSYRKGFRFPRVSGDEPMQQRELTADVLFSPRERG